MRAVLILLVPLLFSAGAARIPEYCWEGVGQPALGLVQVGDGTAGHTFYVWDYNWPLGAGTWIYEESNGIFAPYAPLSQDHARENVQTGGVSAIVPDDDDPCDMLEPPDTLIY